MTKTECCHCFLWIAGVPYHVCESMWMQPHIGWLEKKNG